MSSLFVDSTYDITLGVLDDELGWINFERFVGQKSSHILQKETHRLLSEAHVKPSHLKKIITIGGPGFYTGLRLSEGIADVFTFSGIKHYSFLTYDIPSLLGVHEGIWMTKAYRGEYFFHVWKDGFSENILIAEKELEKYVNGLNLEQVYIHSDSALDELSRRLIPNAKPTHDLLKANSKVIFNHFIGINSKVESFYFRAPEDEFRVST